MSRRVLVIGGTGMLGHKLVQVLSAEPGLEVHCTVRRRPPPEFAAAGVRYHEGVRIAYGETELRRVLDRVAPAVVINAVGAIKQKDLSNVDETFYLNATLPHLLALHDGSARTRLVHFSTDCVFRGDRGGYREEDAPDAVDVYGRSKACGEVGYANHLTLRTSIIGWEISGHLGLLGWLLRQPRGATLPGYAWAIFSGLPTVTLARTVRDLIHHHSEMAGLFQVASEPISKLALLERINRRLRLGFDFRAEHAVEIDRSLDDSRFRARTATARPGWDALVEELAEDAESLPYADLYPLLRPTGVIA